MQTIQCRRCHETKPETDFSLNGTRRIRTCKKCRAEHWRLVHGDKPAERKERQANIRFNQLAKWPAPGKPS